MKAIKFKITSELSNSLETIGSFDLNLVKQK